MWASPSDIATTAQPYKPKSPPTMPYVEEKKAKQQKKLTVLKIKAMALIYVTQFFYLSIARAVESS